VALLKLPNRGAKTAADALVLMAKDKNSIDTIVSAGVMVHSAIQCSHVVIVQNGHNLWYSACLHPCWQPNISCCTLDQHNIEVPGSTAARCKLHKIQEHRSSYPTNLRHGLF